jgi:uncharacterized membrane protein
VVSLYDFYLLVHVVTAVVWVGGGVAIQLFAFRVIRSDDPVRIAGFSRDVEWVGTRIFIPASLLLLIFGFLLVHERNWSYDFWLVWGLVVYAIGFVAGVAFLGPESGKIGKLIQDRGPTDAEAQRRIRRR